VKMTTTAWNVIKLSHLSRHQLAHSVSNLLAIWDSTMISTSVHANHAQMVALNVMTASLAIHAKMVLPFKIQLMDLRPIV